MLVLDFFVFRLLLQTQADFKQSPVFDTNLFISRKFLCRLRLVQLCRQVAVRADGARAHVSSCVNAKYGCLYYFIDFGEPAK